MGRPRKYSPEVRERAVRLVFDQEHQHDSQWAATALDHLDEFFHACFSLGHRTSLALFMNPKPSYRASRRHRRRPNSFEYAHELVQLCRAEQPVRVPRRKVRKWRFIQPSRFDGAMIGQVVHDQIDELNLTKALFK